MTLRLSAEGHIDHFGINYGAKIGACYKINMNAKEINQKYLNTMRFSTDTEKVLLRIKQLWWPHFEQCFSDQGPGSVLDNLDISMGSGRLKLNRMAADYAKSEGAIEGTSRHIQLAGQFLKSNTGKMFESFIGLAVAHALSEAKSEYCIMPFRNNNLGLCWGTTPESLEVVVKTSRTSYVTKIDADLFCFNPSDAKADIYLISIKSTLKDRFHNVPFWNLLRHAAVSRVMPHLEAKDEAFLRKVKYVAICSDLAAEQPDFSSEDGPRNLLSLDASLLDAAYVSSSRARGLGIGRNHMGLERDYPFYPLSSFYSHLCD